MNQDQERWAKIQSVFDMAIQEPLEERSQFLDLNCRGDDELRAEIESLLSSFDDSEQSFKVLPIGRTIQQHGKSEADCNSIPHMIPGYEIVREVHRGGQGIVYEAIQLGTKRRVALKVMLEGPFAGPSSKRRFEREVELTGSLRHPGIVPVFDSGINLGRYFFAMEFIDGLQFNSYCRQHQLTERDLLGLFAKICDAVDHAHQKGVIHRDLKPSNILVDERGEPRVVDFGLAKLDETHRTDMRTVSRPGQVMGTPLYMSPEQAFGKLDEIDMRTDVYSLGVLLYEVLAGKTPYEEGKTIAETLHALHFDEPVPPRQFNRSVSSEAETIIMKAMAKERTRRYSTAGSLGSDVRRLMVGEPIEAKRDSVAYFIGKTLQKHWVAAATTIAFLLMLVGSTVVGWTFFLRADRARDEASIAAAKYERQRDTAEELRDQNRRQLYFAKMNLAGQVTSERFGTDTVRAALARWAPTDNGEREGLPDLRGWEWYYLYGRSHREEFQSEPLNGWTWAADYNPECSEYVVGINGWGFQVRDAQTGRVLRERKTGSLHSVDWSDDGSMIGIGDMRGAIQVFNSQTLKPIWTRELGIGKKIAPLQFSPNGKHIAVSSQQSPSGRFVLILDAADGSPVQQIEDKSGVHEIDWSPDSRLVAVSRRSGQIGLWDALTGDQVKTLKAANPGGSAKDFPWIAWSHDGNKLAVSAPLRIWEVRDDREFELDLPIQVASIDWHPSGELLACGSPDGRVYVIDDSGRQINELSGHTGSVRSVQWSADGDHLLSCGLRDLSVRIWRTDSRDRSQFLRVDDTSVGVKGVAWSPDGKLIAFTKHYSSTIEIWNVEQRKIVYSFDSPDAETDQIAFSRDGRELAWTSQSGANVLDIESGMSSPLVNSPIRSAGSLAWHFNGRLAIGFRDPVSRVVVWDSSQSVVAEFQGNAGIVASRIAWNASGTRLAMASVLDGLIYLWDVEENRVLWNVNAGSVKEIVWSADDKTLITSTRGALVMRDATTGTEIRRLATIREPFGRMDYSSTSDRLAVGSPSSLSLWDLSSGQVPIRFKAHVTGHVRWSPDGLCVAAGCHEGLRLWDARRGYELLRSVD